MNDPFNPRSVTHEQALPAWDSPGAIILDGPALLGNLDRCQPADAVFDARRPLLAATSELFLGELLRRGIAGMIVSWPVPRLVGLPKGFRAVLAPPFDSGMLREAVRRGVSPVLGHQGEAILASNEAQAVGRPLPVFLRVRGGDLMADSGPTGVLSLLELLPSLPMLELVGLFLDEPFSGRMQCDALDRAMARFLPETRGVMLVGGKGGAQPVRGRTVTLIDQKILGCDTTDELFTATLTIRMWGFPVAARESSFQVGVDLGTRHGIPRESRPHVLVAGEHGRVVAVQEHRMLIELPQRPESPSPWIVTLLGSSGTAVVAPGEWPEQSVPGMVESWRKLLPLWVRPADAKADLVALGTA